MNPTIKHLRKDYRMASLDERSVVPDPVRQFNAWLCDAMMAGIDEPNAMVLSTVSGDGKVSARVVLLKGTEKNTFQFFTNYHSRKGLHLASNPSASLTFYWKELERQVRVEGLVRKLPRLESRRYFENRPLESRISACISPQSSVIPDRDFLSAMREGFILDLNGAEPPCPVNWGGYKLMPQMVEFWQGRENRLHDRLCYRKQGTKWFIERLAP